MAKLTLEERKAIEEMFDNEWAEQIYNGNVHSYIKEVEQIKDMTEEELRAKYPTAYYWLAEWGIKPSGVIP